MGVNIKQVANRANVSPATVSKYLNGIKISAKNYQSIENAVKELNFNINEFARGLRTNKSKTIGILLPELNSPFSMPVISVIENKLMEFGYSTIICDFKSNPQLGKQKLDFMMNKKIDGLIVMPYYLDIKILSEIKIPIVSIDAVIENVDCDCVIIDNAKISYEATNYIIEHGHKKIAAICGPENIYTMQERLKGYVNACSDNKITINPEYIIYGNADMRTGYEAIQKLLDMTEPPTAVFAVNDDLMEGALTALNDRVIKIGEDISFVGFDNVIIANIVNPKLSIVVQPLQKIGETAANLLLSKLREKSDTTKIIKLKAELLRQFSVCKI
ncbi:MAG: LacI family transcriptional regulator [Oscillospiraceae bacterium]|nr:LacI family transcriptional regulator [Oscillospiraceae bacterium]